MKTLVRFLKQPSTVRGIIVLAGLFGYQIIQPEQLSDLLSFIAGLLGIVEVLRDEG